VALFTIGWRDHEADLPRAAACDDLFDLLVPLSGLNSSTKREKKSQVLGGDQKRNPALIDPQSW
jgi:hypothetical protein